MSFLASLYLLILMTQTLYSNSLDAVTSCSRLEWEEKMLEKMVRTEITAKEYMEKLERALETLKEQTRIVEDMQKNLEKTIENTRKESADKLKALEHVVWGFKDHLITPTVAFNVRKVLQATPADFQIIRFKVILLNLGQAYDEVTGIFTAPVNGTYLFGVQACSYSSKQARLEIAVDAVNTVISFVSDYETSSSYTSASGFAVVYLNKGQRVWVQNRESSTSLYDNRSYCWNQFTGVLIHI